MKVVRVLGQNIDERVLCDWDNIVAEDNEKLGLKKGDDFTIFYRNKKDRCNFQGEIYPAYEHPYHPQEKLNRLINLNPLLHVMIKKFDLTLTV
jgi:hypothetical protein